MGTRGLIRLCDSKGQTYANIYNHYDSYPDVLGVALYKFLRGFTTIVNEYNEKQAEDIPSGVQYTGKHTTRAGCIFAQLIAHLKGTVGSVYLEPVSGNDSSSYLSLFIEYVYEISVDGAGKITVKIFGHGLAGEPMDVETLGAFCNEKAEQD